MKKLLLVGVMLASPALADDHVIKPQCWDENVNGTVQRHCEVQRNAQERPLPPSGPAPEPSPDAPQVAAPQQYPGVIYDQYGVPHYPNPPGYYGPPPVYFQPGYQPGYGYGPGYYPPFGVPGPLAVFRFGPFRFVIP